MQDHAVGAGRELVGDAARALLRAADRGRQPRVGHQLADRAQLVGVATASIAPGIAAHHLALAEGARAASDPSR